MGGPGQPQHLAQSPEGIGIGLQAGLFGHPQEGAHIGEGPQGKAAFARGAGGPDGGFVIQARRVGDGDGVFQRTQLKSTLAAGRGKAQAGEVLRDLREFERVEGAAAERALPSTRPLWVAMMAEMTLPISRGEVAPTSAMVASMRAVSSSSVRGLGR